MPSDSSRARRSRCSALGTSATRSGSSATIASRLGSKSPPTRGSAATSAARARGVVVDADERRARVERQQDLGQRRVERHHARASASVSAARAAQASEQREQERGAGRDGGARHRRSLAPASRALRREGRRRRSRRPRVRVSSAWAVVLPSSVTCGRSFSRLASPMPFTSSRSSTLLEAAAALARLDHGACARDSPMPGRSWSSSGVAVFTFTTPLIALRERRERRARRSRARAARRAHARSRTARGLHPSSPGTDAGRERGRGAPSDRARPRRRRRRADRAWRAPSGKGAIAATARSACSSARRTVSATPR